MLQIGTWKNLIVDTVVIPVLKMAPKIMVNNTLKLQSSKTYLLKILYFYKF